MAVPSQIYLHGIHYRGQSDKASHQGPSFFINSIVYSNTETEKKQFKKGFSQG